MRCFVTGGCGFLGSHAVRQLVAPGAQVAVLALPGESRRRLRDIEARIEWVEADLADTPAVGSFLNAWRPDACLHCAWYAEPGRYLDSPKNIECLRDSLALIELLAAAGCRSAVMAGTCAEYDTTAGWLKETGPVAPATLYAASKLATALVGQQRAAQTRVRFAWARMFYLFGPGEDGRRMVPAAIQTLLAGREFPASMGDQIRDYLHVEDAAAGLVALLCAAASGVFNVCSGEPVTVRRLLELIAEEIGAPGLIRWGAAPPRDWEPPFICGDPGRLRSLGWQRRYELRDALRQTIDYWRGAQSQSGQS